MDENKGTIIQYLVRVMEIKAMTAPVPQAAAVFDMVAEVLREGLAAERSQIEMAFNEGVIAGMDFVERVKKDKGVKPMSSRDYYEENYG